ncbi:MAG: NAD-dependent succinate-semialdehyde dehydrogenase [Pseudomonadota bacterium]|nr:NAD-dependent succinate-semialdehyde dehydrogenase [Pseudomonadota bacterium]MDE3037850.1 NAD-dependent succinate-semialdehyde dehydrogenase [Pseudomonadota bacterium]
MQTSVNPATGEKIRDYPLHSAADVQAAIARAHECFLHWKTVSTDERARLLLRVAEILLTRKDGYARLIAREMGKPLKEAIAEVEKCAGCARYFAENGALFLADSAIATEYRKSYVAFLPLGIIFGIMPWNFPFWQVFRFALPSLMAGNIGLLKHSSNTPGCALAIESIFREAGLPEGAFQALLLPSDRIEEAIGHPRVAAITLTGSTPAGRSVAALAGKHLKKTVLELGGSDAYLILPDADVSLAVKTCAASRLLNCGQSCISAKRLIVAGNIRERFEQELLDIFRKQRTGDPLDAETTVGPMARADLRNALHEQVDRSIAAGARCLTGGVIPAGKGAFYPPTILTDVKKGMSAYEEELFGPVAVIIPAKDEEDAIAIANDTPFGLGGAIFTADFAHGEAIARGRVESGSCFVNMMVRSDVRLPFGGIRDSGYGRELSAFGIREFVNVKSIVVA